MKIVMREEGERNPQRPQNHPRSRTKGEGASARKHQTRSRWGICGGHLKEVPYTCARVHGEFSIHRSVAPRFGRQTAVGGRSDSAPHSREVDGSRRDDTGDSHCSDITCSSSTHRVTWGARLRASERPRLGASGWSSSNGRNGLRGEPHGFSWP